MTASPARVFCICKDALTGKPAHHGKWHPDPSIKMRYLDIWGGVSTGGISGYVSPEAFIALMRALVSAEYDTPNWCEKCHLAGNGGCCRCEIACNE